ncbi:hypothetical protein H4582DRAFT_2082417 [Lactarius indigo]|nr:hypothetical protein H4582DRAFT_2082417 [Lactarius indigo]
MADEYDVHRFNVHAAIVTGLVFLTALSGAFVAGPDAGLVYSEFPPIGGPGHLVRPSNEPATLTSATGHWQEHIVQFFANLTTMQSDHRVLATTMYLATAAPRLRLRWQMSRWHLRRTALGHAPSVPGTMQAKRRRGTGESGAGGANKVPDYLMGMHVDALTR